MLSEELKNLVSQLGSLAVVENNQPRFIIMTYDKFNSVIHKSVDNSSDFDKNRNEESEEIIDRLNEEIFALKEQVSEKEKDLIARE